MKNYYETLGVERDATAADIKKAWRKLAQENHPDRNPGDRDAEARFKEAAEAYEVLNDEVRRRQHDDDLDDAEEYEEAQKGVWREAGGELRSSAEAFVNGVEEQVRGGKSLNEALKEEGIRIGASLLGKLFKKWKA